jgi:hypothetical protein
MRRIVRGIRQTGAVARPSRLRPLFAAVALAVVATACGGGNSTPKALGPNPTSSDPGPNSTSVDPGPNPTTNGPTTVEGTLGISGNCIVLQRAGGALDLHFEGYTTRGTSLVDDTNTVVANRGDQIAVAGHSRGTKTACGTRFDVANLVTVVPKG